MDDREFCRVFDQIQMGPDREEAMLERLLRQERRTRPVKQMKKTVAVLVAAALLLMVCAFTVATGLDQRLLELFSGGQENEGLLADGAVNVNASHTYENGWTVEIGQALVDRYSLAVLVDVIAPEGTVLDGDDYFIFCSAEITPEPDGEDGVGSWTSGSWLLTDEDPDDNHLAFLWHRGPTSYLKTGTQEFIGHNVMLHPLWLKKDWSVGKETADFSEDKWNCTVKLPDMDSGRSYQINQAIAVGEEQWTLGEVYISPISLAYYLTGSEEDEQMWGPPEASDWEGKTFLNTVDGKSIPASGYISITYDPNEGQGDSALQIDQIINPADVVSVTILGQTFSLDGLIPVEG